MSGGEARRSGCFRVRADSARSSPDPATPAVRRRSASVPSHNHQGSRRRRCLIFQLLQISSNVREWRRRRWDTASARQHADEASTRRGWGFKQRWRRGR
nr:unnamed protein product [Digitaria exilis]